MKLQINMILSGADSMEEKFLKSIAEYPEMQMDLIRANIHLIMVAFRFGKDENIVLEHFKAGKIIEEVPAPIPVPTIEKMTIEEMAELAKKEVES